jgi:ABC-type sugar transport system ATPase subunit
MIALALRGIGKDFPGVRALDGVDLTLEGGRILALCGENGAGKSTLVRILSGVYPHGSYEGEIVIDGTTRRFSGTREAEEAGVAIIHQELSVFPEMTVAENIFIGHEDSRRGVIDWAEVHDAARRHLRRHGLDLDPAAKVQDLKLGQRQILEIARALHRNARILVLDEPTSALSARDVETLFAIMKRLRDDGAILIYISHRIEELRRICDDVAVLRDGKSVLKPTPFASLSKEEILRAMVGRDVSDRYPHLEVARGPALLEVEEWQVRNPLLPGEFMVADVNFKVHAGEIFGIYGMMGSGRTEVVTGIFAGFPPECFDGTLKIAGRTVSFREPRDAIAAGVAFVTEDRKYLGLALDLSVGANLSLPSLGRVASWGVIDEAADRDRQKRVADELRIKTPSLDQFVRNLSGGNQQKVVFGRWLATEPQVLLLDEPTRGIDVGAKQEIYRLLNDLKSRGVAIVMVTSDLPELLGMSDRVMVMHEGWQVGTFDRREFDVERIGALATGNV